MNAYKGYSLFNDVADENLRNSNRARVMLNIFEQYTKIGKISQKGAALVLGYFANLPEKERQAPHDILSQMLKERGYAAQSN